MANKEEPARFSRQASPVSLVPRKDKFKELEGILGMCWMTEAVVWRGLPGCEPIVGKRDREACGYGKLAGQGSMISLILANAVTISMRSTRDEDRMPHALHAPP